MRSHKLSRQNNYGEKKKEVNFPKFPPSFARILPEIWLKFAQILTSAKLGGGSGQCPPAPPPPPPSPTPMDTLNLHVDVLILSLMLEITLK